MELSLNNEHSWEHGDEMQHQSTYSFEASVASPVTPKIAKSFQGFCQPGSSNKKKELCTMMLSQRSPLQSPRVTKDISTITSPISVTLYTRPVGKLSAVRRNGPSKENTSSMNGDLELIHFPRCAFLGSTNDANNSLSPNIATRRSLQGDLSTAIPSSGRNEPINKSPRKSRRYYARSISASAISSTDESKVADKVNKSCDLKFLRSPGKEDRAVPSCESTVAETVSTIRSKEKRSSSERACSSSPVARRSINGCTHRFLERLPPRHEDFLQLHFIHRPTPPKDLPAESSFDDSRCFPLSCASETVERQYPEIVVERYNQQSLLPLQKDNHKTISDVSSRSLPTLRSAPKGFDHNNSLRESTVSARYSLRSTR